jgi:hypothetical protein
MVKSLLYKHQFIFEHCLYGREKNVHLLVQNWQLDGVAAIIKV